MKYTLFCLLFIIAVALAQQVCLSLDAGTYSCSVDHPGHSAHDATMVFTDGSIFSYDSSENDEECTVAGAYVLALDTMTLTSTTDIACIVDAGVQSSTIIFSDCGFNSGCNSFDCEATADNGKSTLSCQIDNNNASNNTNVSNSNDNSSASTLFFGVLALATTLLF